MKPKKNQVTIYDVAYKAGVSITTVSRVLNNSPGVLEETRQKVAKTISDLSFKPNPVARSLVVKQVNLIQVCFSWSSAQFKINLENPWYLELLNGINKIAQEKQYGLLINTLSGVFDTQEVYRRVSRNAVDGILLVSPYLKEEELLQIKNYPIPVVLVGSHLHDPQIDFVDSDNPRAVAEVVDHLKKLGHRKIACITGEIEISGDAAERLEEFQNTMARRRLALPDAYLTRGDFSKESGYKAMKKLLNLEERPTAVFASNDLMALGAWDALKEEGLMVGKEMALVGFDDIPAASQGPYSLTTVRQDFQAISTQAANLLIEKMKNPNQWKSRQIRVPTQLVVRHSTDPKKKQARKDS
jgi:LacI family transcriptional regulator